MKENNNTVDFVSTIDGYRLRSLWLCAYWMDHPKCITHFPNGPCYCSIIWLTHQFSTSCAIASNDAEWNGKQNSWVSMCVCVCFLHSFVPLAFVCWFYLVRKINNWHGWHSINTAISRCISSRCTHRYTCVVAHHLSQQTAAFLLFVIVIWTRVRHLRWVAYRAVIYINTYKWTIGQSASAGSLCHFFTHAVRHSCHFTVYQEMCRKKSEKDANRTNPEYKINVR